MATNEERYKQSFSSSFSPNWTSQYNTFGKHGAKLSPDNPYYTQLNQAMSAGDEDALFELAVKWEAENAGYERERADKLSDLADQRAYDDPLAVVQRNRRAGINSDIQGSSTIAGSSGSGAPSMPSFDTPTDNTSKFSNQADRHSLLLNGLSSVASVVSGIGSLGQTIINGISTMSMLPLQKDALSLSNELTEEQINAQRVANLSSELGLIDNSLNTLNTLSGFITPDTSDEDATAILSSLGFADRAPQLLAGVRQYHSNPAFKAQWEQNKSDAIEKEERGKIYTREVFSNLHKMTQQLSVKEQALDFATTSLQASVAEILNTDGYAKDLANLSTMSTYNSLDEATVESKQLDLANQMIERNLEVYGNQLQHLQDAISYSQSLIDKVYSNSQSRGFLTPEEEAFVRVESEKIKAYETLGAEFMGNIHSMVLDTFRRSYFEDRMMRLGTGEVRNYAGHPDILNFLNQEFTFTDITKGTIGVSDAVQNTAGGLMSMLKLLISRGKSAVQ